MNEFYYGIKTDKIITPFGFIQIRFNNQPVEFLYKLDSVEYNGASYTIYRLFLDLENYKINDDLFCTIDKCKFEHLTSDENFCSAYIENENYYLTMGVYDSEENGYWPPFEHCFEAYDCDTGVYASIFDDPNKYVKNYTRYFRVIVAWLPKTVYNYDEITDMIIDHF